MAVRKKKPSTVKRKSRKVKKVSTKKHLPMHKGGNRVYYQDLKRFAPSVFRRPSVQCLSHFTTSMSVVAKTPREKAFYCRGMVRLGRDGKTLYYARIKMKRNPRRYSYGMRGFHTEFKWNPIFDRTTGKHFDAKKLSPWQRAFLF